LENNVTTMHKAWLVPKDLDSRIQTHRHCAGQKPEKELFKLSKFKSVDSRVTAFMGKAKPAAKIESHSHEDPVPEPES
jgi:hypothetical protein